VMASNAPNNPMVEAPKHLDASDSYRSQLIDLLGSEIERINAENAQPGWTSWAILGAFAGIVWLLIDSLEKAAPSPENVGVLFFGFAAIVDALALLWIFVSAFDFEGVVKGRYHFSNRLASNKQLALYLLGSSVLFCAMAFKLQSPLGPLASGALILTYAVKALRSLVVIVLSFLRLPVKISAKGPKFGELGVILALHIVTTIFLYEPVSRIVVARDFGALRVALLAYALVYLVYLFLRGGRPSPLLQSFLAIRRDLVLRQTEPEVAMRQIDMALAGMRIADVLQTDIKAILDDFDGANREYSEAVDKLGALRVVIAQRNDALRKSTQPLTGSVLDAVGTHLNCAGALLASIEGKIKRLNRKIQFLSPDMDEKQTMDEIFRSIDAASADLSRKSSKIKAELTRFQTESHSNDTVSKPTPN
jgi:hypothetical protein